MVFPLVIDSGTRAPCRHPFIYSAGLSWMKVNFLNQTPCIASWPCVFHFDFFLFFTPALAHGFWLEYEWQQISTSFQDSSQYSGRCLKYCSLDVVCSYVYLFVALCRFSRKKCRKFITWNTHTTVFRPISNSKILLLCFLYIFSDIICHYKWSFFVVLTVVFESLC